MCTRIPDLYVTTGPYRRYERETWPTSSREMFYGFSRPCQHREWLPVFRSANDAASGPLVLSPPLLRRISSLINAISAIFSAIFSAVIVGTFPRQTGPTAPARLSYHCSSILRISDYSTGNNKNSSSQTFRKLTLRTQHAKGMYVSTLYGANLEEWPCKGDTEVQNANVLPLRWRKSNVEQIKK